MKHNGSDQVGKVLVLSLVVCLILMALNLSPSWVARSYPAANYMPMVYRHWPPPTPTPGPGRLLITEVLYDPAGQEPDGEWIELYNAGGLPLELGSYKIGDEETPGELEGMFQFPPGAIIQPGQVVVIAGRALVFAQIYGFNPDYELRESDPLVPTLFKYTAWAGGNVELVNTGDEVIALGPSDEWVDALSWGNSSRGIDPAVPKVADGHSLERNPANVDTDSAADWIDQSQPDPGQVFVSLPTPEVTPTAEQTPGPPSPARLLISEVLFNPLGVSEPAGEWIELYNAGAYPAALSQYKVGDEETAGQGEGMLQFPGGFDLAPGQVVVIANKAVDFFAVYGFTPDFEMTASDEIVPDMLKYASWATGSLNLSNSGDEVLLLDGEDSLADAVAWGNSDFFFDPPLPLVAEGNSLERYPPDADSDTALDWREQSEPAPGQVDLTQPTPTPTPTLTPTPTEIPPPTAVPLLVINEIHADPDSANGDANGDGMVDSTDDEFVEIVNVTGSTVDLGGWTLGDSLGVHHTFPADSLIPDACAVVVFGGGLPAGDFGGSLVQTASKSTLSLNNAGDTVTLYDLESTLVLSYTYGAEGGSDQSLTRDPDVSGPEPLVKHAEAAESGGRLFSPGKRLDGALFAGCHPGSNIAWWRGLPGITFPGIPFRFEAFLTSQVFMP